MRAFDELKTLGWVEGETPRMHAVQAAGSAPVVRAFHAGAEFPEPVKPNTIAKSIAIGNPADGYHVLQTLRETHGTATMVSDDEILQAIQLLAETEGIFTEPAGGATLAGAIELIRVGAIRQEPADRHLHHRQRLQDRRRARGSHRAADPARKRPVRVRGLSGRSHRSRGGGALAPLSAADAGLKARLHITGRQMRA